MAAATDKARKTYSYLQKTLSSGIDDNDTTLTPNNVTNIPPDTGVSFVIDRVDSSGATTPSKRELMTGVVSGSTITDLVRGEQSTTAQAHSAGAVIEFVNSGEMWNDLIDLILAQHNQSGGHTNTTVSGTLDVTGVATFTATPKTDAIAEKTAAAGVTIDGALIKDGFVYGGGVLGAIRHYTYDGTDIFVDGVDQNNAANTISWSKPTNLEYIIVEVLGGGGGGGGADNDRAHGGGGGGGGYSKKKIAAASLGATETVTVGAAGAGGIGTAAGTAGGTSSFGAHATATGGAAGTSISGSAAETGAGGAGGAGASGDFNTTGSPGAPGVVRSTVTTQYGMGGSSHYGSGGAAQVSVSANGNAGSGYGGGGSGAQASSTTDRTGGAGTAGIVIVHEYY